MGGVDYISFRARKIKEERGKVEPNRKRLLGAREIDEPIILWVF